MNIKITGWGYENIRRFGVLDVDLLQGSNHLPHATFIMMRNGTGKTTTITLMRAILSGIAENWSPDIVKGFKPTHGKSALGKFYIKIMFDSEIYIYNLNLNYEQGKASYQTSHVGMSGGLEMGHILPMPLKGVLNNEGFINRFIFDGEQAKKTLNASSKEAELAVKYLYQIDKLDNLVAEIKAKIELKQSKSSSRGACRKQKEQSSKANCTSRRNCFEN